MDDSQYTPVIEDEFFVASSSKYIYQMLNERDYKTALVTTMLIPNSFKKIKTMMLFKVLTSMSQKLIYPKRSDIDFLEKVLRIPSTWISASLAFFFQHHRINEKAI